MRNPIIAAALTMASLCLSGPASAIGVNQFSALVVLGDSLSDQDNLNTLSGGTQPPNPPYRSGRLTNGDVYAEIIGRKFEAKGLLYQNFAVGGATAITNADPIPDLQAQTGLVLGIPDAGLGKKPVVSYLIGANDAFDAINSGLDVSATAQAAANSVADSAQYLHDNKGISNFSFLNLPSIDLTPRFRFTADNPLAAAYTAEFNATLASRAAGLRAMGLNIVEVDIDTPYSAAVLDPTRIGLDPSAALIPCIVPGVSVCDAVDPAEAERFFFYDPVHPASVPHAELAREVSGYIAPVPLPAPLALLLAGLSGLALVRRLGLPGSHSKRRLSSAS